MPTEIWSSRLRCGSAHCCLQLAVEELDEEREDDAPLIKLQALTYQVGNYISILKRLSHKHGIFLVRCHPSSTKVRDHEARPVPTDRPLRLFVEDLWEF